MGQVQNTYWKRGRRYDLDGLVDYGFSNEEFSLVDVELETGEADVKESCQAVFVGCSFGYQSF